LTGCSSGHLLHCGGVAGFVSSWRSSVTATLGSVKLKGMRSDSHKTRHRFTLRSLLIITAIAGLAAFLISLAPGEVPGEGSIPMEFPLLGYIIAVGLVGWTAGFTIRETKDAAVLWAIILVVLVLLIYLILPGAQE